MADRLFKERGHRRLHVDPVIPQFHFKPVDTSQRGIVHRWLTLPHAAEWFYGDGLNNTINHLDEFLNPLSKDTCISHYWLAYEKEIPFAFLITSLVNKPHDALTNWCLAKGETITLDILIGDTHFLGKGLAHLVIRQFLDSQFPQVEEVLIDPEASNKRAIHVYQKAGFAIIAPFTPSHSPHPHYMMRLMRG